jgi:transcriptional regulator with XRE-family HTH domain
MNDFLVKILQERGMSRYRLSKMTGIPQSTIAEWGKNNKTPSADRLAIVADALDVSLDCLIGKTEKSATPSDGFSDDEKKLIKLYRNLSPEEQSAFRLLLQREK